MQNTETRTPPVGIIGAMAEEVAGLVATMQDVREWTMGGMTFYEGMLEDVPVVLVQSGVGKVNAAACAQIVAGHFRARCILNTGIAGSLQNTLHIGDIVVSTDAVQHDVDATVWGYAPGEVPGMGCASYPADEALIALAEDVCREVNPEIGVFRGRIASGDAFIADAGRKERIREDFQADCVEMEGAAIAQICSRNHTPFLILRAVSDQADGSAVADNETFTEEVLRRNDRLIRSMLRRL